MSRARSLCGYWRRLAIRLWKKASKDSDVNEAVAEQQQQQQFSSAAAAGGGQDRASLLMGFHALRQQMMERDGSRGMVMDYVTPKVEVVQMANERGEVGLDEQQEMGGGGGGGGGVQPSRLKVV